MAPRLVAASTDVENLRTLSITTTHPDAERAPTGPHSRYRMGTECVTRSLRMRPPQCASTNVVPCEEIRRLQMDLFLVEVLGIEPQVRQLLGDSSPSAASRKLSGTTLLLASASIRSQLKCPKKTTDESRW